jgi:hypothetical protein
MAPATRLLLDGLLSHRAMTLPRHVGLDQCAQNGHDRRPQIWMASRGATRSWIGRGTAARVQRELVMGITTNLNVRCGER